MSCLCKPYWNDELSMYHEKMSITRSSWVDGGRPRSGQLYECYKNAKCDFRRVHRYHTTQYMSSLDRELDSKAKSNPRLFWKDLKKRKLRQEPYCAGIDFDGVKVRDPDQIRDGWANYFEKLYTPNDGSFDGDWKRYVNNNVDNCYTNLRLLVDREAIVMREQVEQSIKLLPKGKAGGSMSI